MKRLSPARTRWLIVVAFAVGMAWVEAASVYYIRALVDRIEPYQANPLPISGVLGQVELVREAATLVMLLTLGMLAGRTWPRRLGYAAIAFGAWDIFYYVFLRMMCGWPRSLFDWDILFLLPLPWWGPVLAPVCIAGLMIVWGTLATQFTDRSPATSLTPDVVGRERARDRPGARRVHGRRASHAAPGAGRDETSAAGGISLAALPRVPRDDGGAGGSPCLQVPRLTSHTRGRGALAGARAVGAGSTALAVGPPR